MMWCIITQRSLTTGVVTRRFCYQGDSEKDYIELTEEQVESLLEGLGKIDSDEGWSEEPTEEAEEVKTEEEKLAEHTIRVLPMGLEVPSVEEPEEASPIISQNTLKGERFTLKSLMASSKGIVDEDGISQG